MSICQDNGCKGGHGVPSPIAVLGDCYYCNIGFPKRDDGCHYGTQSLGMIPDVLCMAHPVGEYCVRCEEVCQPCACGSGFVCSIHGSDDIDTEEQ